MYSKIALIYMGGTFGCIGEPLSPASSLTLFPMLEAIFPPQYHIECFSTPQIKDSSACAASDWFELILQIQELKLQQFQHFIIIHGTDTMSYAAATLSRFLKQSCQVMITGSQFPLLNTCGTSLRSQSDARENLLLAIDHIHSVAAGVYLAFHHQIFHASTAVKVHSTELNAFTGLSYTETLPSAQHETFTIEAQHLEKIRELNILNLSLRPIEIAQFNLQLKMINTQPPHVLIIQAYGTGNMLVDAQTLAIFKQLHDQGCHVIIDSQVHFGSLDQRYAVSSWIKQTQLLVNDTLSNADLYAKIIKMYLQYPTPDQWTHHWYECP